MKRYVPDFNTLADLIDKLSAENIKLAELENTVEHDGLSDHGMSQSLKEVAAQHEIIETLKDELAGFMEEVFLSSKYEHVKKQRTSAPRIPNYNTLSTLIDRLTIENVKLAHFENAVQNGDLLDHEIAEFQKKIAVQHEIVEALSRELANFMEEAFLSRRYEYMKEERTFI